jgi:hypothetical protein
MFDDALLHFARTGVSVNLYSDLPHIC